jgi:hypothetical protein
MSEKELETFKVGERHAPRVKPSATAAKTAAESVQSPQETLGFARIEELLDSAQPGDVQRDLVQLTDRLDTVMADARGQKEKSQAKRAKMAVERTIDLLAYLFETKEAMLAQFTQADAPKAKGKGKSTQRGTP